MGNDRLVQHIQPVRRGKNGGRHITENSQRQPFHDAGNTMIRTKSCRNCEQNCKRCGNPAEGQPTDEFDSGANTGQIGARSERVRRNNKYAYGNENLARIVVTQNAGEIVTRQEPDPAGCELQRSKQWKLNKSCPG
jgi:hypothetical protein